MDQKRSLEELRVRRAVARAAVLAMAEEAGREDGDPRAPGALAEYEAQLAGIDRQIAEVTGRPPDVVVGLKAASLSAKVE